MRSAEDSITIRKSPPLDPHPHAEDENDPGESENVSDPEPWLMIVVRDAGETVGGLHCVSVGSESVRRS
jgi:hypothetical protein